MDRLKEKYSADVDFFDLNASQAEGMTKMRELRMGVHGYAVLTRWGCIWWRSAGHAFTPELLENQIQGALAAAPGEGLCP